MPVLQDRVQETTTTGGTGTITLAGAVTGYRSFAQAFSIGQETYYTIDNGNGEWEIGVGTVGSGTLSRDSVLESSNSNALVNFSAGTKRVFCSAPTKVLLPDETGNSGKVLTTNGTDPSWTTTLNGMTIGNITPGTGAFTTLSASSTVSGTGFSTYLASPPAIGGTTPAAGAFTTLSSTGNTTLGDASADTLTINGTAVSCPNNLNFDSDTLFIDAANNRVGIGTSSPNAKLQVVGAAQVGNFSTSAHTAFTVGATSSDTGGIKVRFGNSATLQYSYIGDWYTGETSYIQFIRNSGTGAGQISIGTSPSGFSPIDRLIVDSSGNLGLGVTPSGWSGGNAGFQTPYGWIVGNNQVNLYCNTYYNAGGKYVQNGYASGIAMSTSGGIVFSLAGNNTSGAGAAATFTQAMTLDASGNLLVGNTSIPAGGVTPKVAFLSGTTAGITTQLYVGPNGGTLGQESQIVFGTTFSSAWGGGDTYPRSAGAISFGTYGGNANPRDWSMKFWIGDSSDARVERMRLDSSGNLGLGVTPSGWSSAFGVLDIKNYGALSTGNDPSLHLTVNAYYNGASWAYKAGSIPAVKYSQYAGGHYWYTATSGTAGNNFTFTQAMTLDASGNLLVGTTSQLASGSHSFYNYANNGIITLRNSGAAAGKYFGFGPDVNNAYVVYNQSGTGVFLHDGATAWSANSDERLKENLLPIENAVAKVSTLRAVTGRYIADEESVSRAFLIAQDVQAVLPEAVDDSDPDKLSLRYTETIPLLVAAIKELHAEIELLKAKVN